MIFGLRRARALFGLLVVAGAIGAHGDTRADDAGAIERRLRVVARVGKQAITVGELEDRIGNMPPFQRASFGATVDAVRRRFLTDVVERDELLALGAEGQRLGDQPAAAYRIERAFSAATIRAVRARVGPAATIAMDDVQRYYDDNRARYEAPERYQLWRILCKTREEAQSVLDATKRDPTPATFATLARDHSLDKATNLRGGNLGFVTADGNSREPGLRVDPAVVRAAQAVRDGALVAEPVVEGEYFSVVWRRGTIASTRRSVGDVAAQIRDALWKGRVKEETDKLVAGLRATNLRAIDPTSLEALSIPSDVEGAMPKARSGGGG
ncbi:MAG TPA: peptidyl-prolyl cis-trans isomerase [Polyangiaceae bacterium]|nr:peptidyl-prolyl cis-trans isomerase [Polyangiaceae bacterium]